MTTEIITLQCPSCARIFESTPTDPVLCPCGRIVRADTASGDYRMARGVLPMQPGDERPEDTIRRLRDTEWLSAELSKGAEHE